MRIGVVTTSYPRFDGDYAGSFVGDRVERLASEGHEVEVLAAGDEFGTRQPGVTRLSSEILRRGADLFYGEGAPEVLERGGVEAWSAAVRFSTRLAAAVRERAPRWQAIESHWLVPCALAAAAGAPDIPRRAYAHSGDVALLERIPFGRALARFLASSGTELRFVSADLRRRFLALAGASGARAHATVEPLAVSARLFARRAGPDPTLRERFGLESPTVLAVGRLVPIKGHDVLLRACALAQGVENSVDVVILGDGPERPRLGRLATQLGVRLSLPGFVPRPEVAAWLAAADLYAQPSVQLASGRTEGAPVATLEALAVGIPVVATSDPYALGAAIRSHLGRGHAAVGGV
jgi:glycosyltransferase involved in cell wall biosynthesis